MKKSVIFFLVLTGLIIGLIAPTQAASLRNDSQKQTLEEKSIQKQHVLEKIQSELKKRGYDTYNLIGIQFYHDHHPQIQIEISNKDPQINKTKKNIRKIVSNILKENNLKHFSINISSVDFEKKEVESKWMGTIIPQIDKRLKDISTKYTGIAIDFHSSNLIRITIQSSMQRSEPSARKTANKLIKEASKVIKLTNDGTLIKNGKSYVIIVKGENKKDIRSCLFK